MATSARLIAVTVVGVDRPGIVAAITRVLYERGCNLEDVSSTILRGHFSMMLVVGAPGDLDPAALEDELAAAGTDLGLTVTVRPVEMASPEVAQPTHMLSVYGADQPGIVFRVATSLADAGVNITDLTSRVIGEPSAPVYALMLEVVVPDGLNPDSLLSLGSDLDVEVSIHPVEADLL